MNPRRALAKAATIAAAIGLLAIVYVLLVRPYQLHWGATGAEEARRMPGDELSFHPTFLATRAITIDGTPADIWPWLIQMGYGRAGFYGYDMLENLGSARGIRSADRIVPELQHLAAGDPLPLSAVAGLVVHAVAPNDHLVWSGQAGEYPGAFTWALYPVDGQHTRLVNRIQWTHHRAPLSLVALDVFTEFSDFVAVKKILHGVKDRVEGRAESFAVQNVEFVVYVWALLVWLAAIALALWRPLTWRTPAITVGAGLAWLFVWYAPVPLAVGALATLTMTWGVYRGGVA